MRNTSVCKDCPPIYLDHAATSWPKPDSVAGAMASFLRDDGGNPGRGAHALSRRAQAVIDDARRAVARLINAPDADRVVFTLNCTDSLNLALKGLLKPGDTVITDAIGHNSLARPLRRLEASGVRVIRLSPSPGGEVDPRDIERALDKDTRLLAFTHAENVTGLIQPVQEYGAVAARHGVPLLVDAAQTAGVFPLDVQDAHIDLLAFSGHKGLLGPPGTGVLYIGGLLSLTPLREGGTGTRSESDEQPAEPPARYESGTPNSVGIAGLGAGVRFILDQTVAAVGGHKRALADDLREGLEEIPGVVLHGRADSRPRAPVVSFTIPGLSPAETAAILDGSFGIMMRAGLHCNPQAHRAIGTFPEGSVRAGIGWSTTADEIERTLAAVREIARAAG